MVHSSRLKNEIELDTECLLLLGILLCKDRFNRKAQVLYSILKSGSKTGADLHSSTSMNMTMNNMTQSSRVVTEECKFDELYCVDEHVERNIFKMCILSSHFIEFYALPARLGRTEMKMLQTAFAMRSNVYFKVFKTFIQHLTLQPEQFYVSRTEFEDRIGEYPLKHFLQPSTLRKMILLQMPEQAAGIMKSKAKLERSAEVDSSLDLLEIKSRPNMGRYRLRPNIYEKEEKQIEQSF